MQFETMGDWCKWLERNFSPDIMIPTLPVIIRLDGNGFSKWTKGLDKPYDDGLNKLMVETTKHLVEETNAVIGYTQSDEITLMLYTNDKKSSIYNDGKKQKILSKLTAVCVNFFNEERKRIIPHHNKVAVFDCRIYQTPTLHDACVQLLWRENDAIKNSIQMLAQSMFSHKELFGYTTTQLIQKMKDEFDIDWNELDSKFKRGSYIKRVKMQTPFSVDELAKLPHNHNARINPNMLVERNVSMQMDYPQLNTIENLVDVLIENKTAILK